MGTFSENWRLVSFVYFMIIFSNLLDGIFKYNLETSQDSNRKKIIAIFQTVIEILVKVTA